MREKARLILTVGFPRSGKTTWVREYSREHGIPVVSPDAIRKRLCGLNFRAEIETLVWSIADTMVAALAEYHDVIILDATNLTDARRSRWVHDYIVQLAVFSASADVCMERARACGREDLVPVIKRMSVEMQHPADPNYEVIYHDDFRHPLEKS